MLHREEFKELLAVLLPHGAEVLVLLDGVDHAGAPQLESADGIFERVNLECVAHKEFASVRILVDVHLDIGMRPAEGGGAHNLEFVMNSFVHLARPFFVELRFDPLIFRTLGAVDFRFEQIDLGLRTHFLSELLHDDC